MAENQSIPHFEPKHIPETSGRRPTFNEPFFLQWHITDKCPSKCIHCYRDESKRDLQKDELLGILKNFADFLKHYEIPGRIQFTGGEPFTSPYLPLLIRQARRYKIPSRILSGGMLLKPDKVLAVKESGCTLVQLSVEGNEERHEAIRGKGSYKMLLENASLLKAEGFEVTFSMTLSRLNMMDIRHVFRLAEEHVDRVHFSRLVPTGAGSDLREQMLSTDEWEKAQKQILRLRSKAKIDVPLRDPTWRGWHLGHRAAEKFNTVCGCSAGYNGLTVESDGTAYPCRRLPISLGNVLEKPIVEIWKHGVLCELRDRDALKGRCGECAYRWLCGGCRAIPYALTNEHLGEDPQCFWGTSGLRDGIRRLRQNTGL